MIRAYLRFDPMFFERKVLEQGYSPALALALVGVFCVAESQPERGRFRSAKLLAALLDRYGRYVPELVHRGDLIELPDGRVYADGWDEWQEGDWKVSERVERIRGRRKPTALTVTSTVTPTVDSIGVGNSKSEGISDRIDVDAFRQARGKDPTVGQLRVMDDFLDTFDKTGPARAVGLIEANPSDPIGALMADLKTFRASRR